MQQCWFHMGIVFGQHISRHALSNSARWDIAKKKNLIFGVTALDPWIRSVRAPWSFDQNWAKSWNSYQLQHMPTYKCCMQVLYPEHPRCICPKCHVMGKEANFQCSLIGKSPFFPELQRRLPRGPSYTTARPKRGTCKRQGFDSSGILC